ncbi:MAG: N-acetylmuramic acid 6-phosphate etherase [Candidatus Kapaibacteriales bacterium]
MENNLFKEISQLTTEQNNPRSKDIDIASTEEILEIINYEDKLVAYAVEKEIPSIALAVELIVDSFRKGGRLFYIGAGTSGRIGVLDSAECPPTFGTNPEMVQAIIAGGKDAVFVAQEGAEDNEDDGIEQVRIHNILPPDVLCGIAASGRTPFVRGALVEARRRNVKTIFISTSPIEQVKQLGINADIYICPVVGPEVIAGSTRMKSGTAQKFILNMLSTASMVRLGKTFGNVMIDLQMTNNKLRERAKKIIMDITSVDYDTAVEFLEKADWHVKTALVMILGKVDQFTAKRLINDANGFVKIAIKMAQELDGTK